MARAWPSLAGRARVSSQLFGQVALGVVLAVALGFTWRDGVSIDESVDAGGPPQSGLASMQVSGNNLSGKPFVASNLPVVAPAPPPQPLIPTAPPVQLLISALDVHRAVEAVGVDRFGIIRVPVNAWNAGWYKGGPVPGAPGDAVIEGHAGYPGQPMIFGKLVTLRPGDRIVVVLSDRSRQLFIVASTTSVPVGSAPPGFAEPYGTPRLTLITCTGHFDKKSYSYSARLVVEATYAGPI
ncbi:MAG: class F sortase [Candidatus Dormibacteraeota bacterium]|nr:class F sortase [Candidatus Dormibacteraeota bacterium]